MMAPLLIASIVAVQPIARHGGAVHPSETDCTPCDARWDVDLFGTTLRSGSDPGGSPVDSVQWALDPLHDDAVVRRLALGFEMPFYYDRYDSIAVGVNGFLSFLGNDLPSIAGDRPAPLPCPVQPHASIAPFWADLALGSVGALFFRTTPDSALVEWRGLEDDSGAGPYTFQTRIFPSGEIRLIWMELPAQLTEHVVGATDARGVDGLSVSATPVAGTALTMTRPGDFDGLALLEIVLPKHSIPAGTIDRPTILVANPGDDAIEGDLLVTVTRVEDSQLVATLAPDPAVLSFPARSQTEVRMESWTPGPPGRYRFDAAVTPGLAMYELRDEVLAAATRDTSAVLGGFKASELSDAYALRDPGEWAIRFLADSLAGAEASLVRVSFWEGWPDTEAQEFEIEIFGTGPGGGPSDEGLHSPVSASGSAGFVDVPLPLGVAISDTFFVIIRQPLPFPDCDAVSSDASQDVTLYPRHWARSCGTDNWEKLESPGLGGDLFVELYLSSPVGVAGGAPPAPHWKMVEGRRIQIDWEYIEGARSYRLLRAMPPSADWTVVAELGPHETSYADRPPRSRGVVRYAVAAIDKKGLALISESIDVPIGRGRLLAPAPVPANPRVEIGVELPEGAAGVSVRVYDVAGALVRTLHEGALRPGVHRFVWQGENERGGAAPSGVYLLQLDAGGEIDTRRIVLLR
ncbi:MAG: hypothetical protein CME06_07965 [Gemmatimonadetes bacterium]|nr:hypothetical protein [Gemmatimonadota bacterium]